MVLAKLISQFISWAAIVLVLLRGYPGRRPIVSAACIAGFALGLAGGGILLRAFTGELPFWIIRGAVAGSLIFFWGVSVAAFYRSTGRRYVRTRDEHSSPRPFMPAHFHCFLEFSWVGCAHPGSLLPTARSRCIR